MYNVWSVSLHNFPMSWYIGIANRLILRGIYWCIMKQVCCISCSKPFSIYCIQSKHNVLLVCVFWIFFLASHMILGSHYEERFLTLSMYSTTLSMIMISIWNWYGLMEIPKKETHLLILVIIKPSIDFRNLSCIEPPRERVCTLSNYTPYVAFCNASTMFEPNNMFLLSWACIEPYFLAGSTCCKFLFNSVINITLRTNPTINFIGFKIVRKLIILGTRTNPYEPMMCGKT